MTFGQKLVRWYRINQRELPWRNTQDPYRIWLSEVILQQTRVAQGLPYYERFLKEFPSVDDMARAEEEEILRLWQGLGYYSRARNLHHTAKYIVESLEGNFPKTYSELLKLKGIGEYTAAAVASFAYKEAVAVLDGNVFRVLSRYFGLQEDIASEKGKKQFRLLAKEALEGNRSDIYNQAIMEFGALQCVPKKPNCNICSLQEQCWAFRHQQVACLPIKLSKTKIKNRYLNYLVFLDIDNKTVIQKRTLKDIWRNLYEFPLIETQKVEPKEELFQAFTEEFRELPQEFDMVLYQDKPLIHKLSHQKLHVFFWIARLDISLEKGVLVEDLQQYPFPVIIRNFADLVLHHS